MNPRRSFDPYEPGFLTEEPPLHRAARLGDHDAIRRLVGAAASVDELFNIRTDPGARAVPATPLMVASGSTTGASVETVRLLLELGSSIAPGPSGQSALSFACEGLWLGYPTGGDAARVAALLEAGSDPDVAGGNGMTALARAARTGDAERVRLLLEAGAVLPDAVRHDYELPLYEAVRAGSVDTVRRLLDAGADVHQRAEWSDPVLAHAPDGRILELLLVAGADPRAAGFKDTSIVERIAVNGDHPLDERVAMLRRLVAAGADLDGPSLCDTALVGAAMSGNASGIEALLRAGADPTVGDPMGYACFSFCDEPDPNWERSVDLLVAAGCSVDETPDGSAPLLHAVCDESFGPVASDGINVPVALALLRHGASVDVVYPESGETLLHPAARAGSVVLVEALLTAGVRPMDAAVDGTLPLDVAQSVGAHDCAALLEAGYEAT